MSEELSASARKRAAKKARDAAHAAEAEAAPAPAAPKAKAKAAAAEPKAKAKAEPKAKAAAEPKAKAKAEPKAKAAAEPKAKAAAEPKGKAKAKAKAVAAPPAPEPEPAKPAAKGKAKAKGKAAAAPAPEPVVEAPKAFEPMEPTTIDDGTGGEWEVSTGLSNKAAKRQNKKNENELIQKAVEAQLKAQGLKPGVQAGYIPGMGPASKGQAANTAKAPAGGKDLSVEIQAKVAAALAAAAAAGKAAAAGLAGAPGDAPVEAGSIATVKVPEAKIGRVIGPKGATLKLVQEKTGVTRIDTQGEIFTITGKPDAVRQAEAAIRDLVDKGYTSIAFEDFSENFVKVHPSSFPDLIGKEGSIVKAIKKETGCEINFPDVPKNSQVNKTYKVMLAGSTKQVDLAKQIINDICMYYHHEITHPGFVHEELEVENWALRYIIGSKGSEMKHIQHNWKVKVNVPRDHSMNQKVVIVGEKDQVDRAKAYIEKLLWNAENNSKGRDKVDNDGGDQWGDEGADEPWMAQYLYKR